MIQYIVSSVNWHGKTMLSNIVKASHNPDNIKYVYITSKLSINFAGLQPLVLNSLQDNVRNLTHMYFLFWIWNIWWNFKMLYIQFSKICTILSGKLQHVEYTHTYTTWSKLFRYKNCSSHMNIKTSKLPPVREGATYGLLSRGLLTVGYLTCLSCIPASFHAWLTLRSFTRGTFWRRKRKAVG